MNKSNESVLHTNKVLPPLLFPLPSGPFLLILVAESLLSLEISLNLLFDSSFVRFIKKAKYEKVLKQT